MGGNKGSSAKAARIEAMSNAQLAQQNIAAQKEAANVQGRYNVTSSLIEQLLNSQNQVTPWGSLTYSKTGYETFTLPDGTTVQIPKTTATTSLDPIAQQAFDQERQFDINSNQLAIDQINRVSDRLKDPFTIDEAKLTDRINRMIDPRLDKREARDTSTLDAKLAAQGIKVGSDAYKDATGDLRQSFSDARGEEARQARSVALNEMLTERNQPLSELQALFGYSAVQQPSFQALSKTNVNAPDYLGAVGGANRDAMQAGMAGNAAITKAKNADKAGIQSLISTGASMLFGLPSDERLKVVRERLGTTPGGLPVYAYNYKGDDKLYAGVLAQDVKELVPEAYMIDPETGFGMVDYSKLR